MATKKKTTRRRAQVAPVRSAHWIDLDPFYGDYVLWKTNDGDVCLGEVSHSPGPAPWRPAVPPFGDESLTFQLADLEAAFEELRGRKKARGAKTPPEWTPPYGQTVRFGDLALEREGTHAYAVYAPCGDFARFTAAELRLMIAAIRDLGVTKL